MTRQFMLCDLAPKMPIGHTLQPSALVQGALFAQHHGVEVHFGHGRLPRIILLLPWNGRKQALHTKPKELSLMPVVSRYLQAETEISKTKNKNSARTHARTHVLPPPGGW